MAYGKILPKEVLEIPKLYCINVHASLLPKYRGAGPIQWSVLNGEKETGVTTMIMAEGLDTGDMLLKKSTPIGEDETASELHDRLSVLGAELLIETIERVKLGDITPQKQDDSLSSYAPMLTKELCGIDFSKPAIEIHNQIRGLSDWPCATAMAMGKKLKFYKSRFVADLGKGFKPGETIDNERLIIACGDGNAVEILQLQAEGGRKMSTAEYLRGNKIEKGTVFCKG